MVSQGDEVRDHPSFNLDTVRDLASRGRVHFGGTKAENDSQNLGYGPEDIHDCISCLETSQFRKSIRYQNRRFWMDVYHTRFRAPTGEVDELYVKLHLTNDCLTVILDSIHP